MGENPSSPEDGLEDALRRALSDAVGRIEPDDNGLDSIRGRIGRHPPRPWLLAILSGAVERARFWTWRGHWAWPGWPRHHQAIPAEKQRRRGDRPPLPGMTVILGGWHVGWLTLVAGLTGMVVIASLSLGVQPVRQAIIQAGTTVLHGGGPYPPLPRTDAGTAGTGTPAPDGTGPLAGGAPTAAAQPSPTSAPGSTAGPGHATPGTASPATCQPPTSGATGEPTPATADSGTTAPTVSAGRTISPQAERTANPVTSSPTAAPDQPAVTPDSPVASTSTCAVTPGPTATAPVTPTPTPTTATTPTTPTTQPEVTGASPAPTGATSDGTATPIPVDTPASTATSAPAGPPTGTGPAPATASSVTSTGQYVSPATPAESGSWRWYARLWFLHHERHGDQR